MRPKAYLIIFSDNPKVRNAVAINFGVYCYPKSESKPSKFMEDHGMNYGFESKQMTRILSLEEEKGKIVSSRVHEIN